MGNSDSSLRLEYQYEPLHSPRHIRLLKIQPSPPSLFGAWKPRLIIGQQHLDTLGEPRRAFDALSYTWSLPLRGPDEPNAGDEEPVSCGDQHEIELNDSSFLVSQNLYDALVRLSGHENIIWIDAICINQNDMAERAAQVLLMDEIYSKASCVVVWLGKDESDIRETLLVLTWVNMLLKKYRDSGEFHPDRDKLTDPGFLKRIGYTLSMDPWIYLWYCYSRFFRQRRYFTRGWILQEVGLVQEVLILCGRHEMPGFENELAVHINKIENFKDTQPPRKTGDEVLRLCVLQEQNKFYAFRESLREHEFLREAMLKKDPDFDVETLQPPAVQDARRLLRDTMCAETSRQLWFGYLCFMLLRVRQYHVTNKRDNIYSILGLVKKALPLETPDHFPVKIDYEASVEGVCKDVTTMLIKEVPALTVLSLVEDISFRTTYPELPSWIPNYSYPFCPTPFSWLGVGGFYNASRVALGHQSQHSFDGNTLILQGRKFSTIRQVCTPQREMVRSRWLEPCFNMCADLPQPYFRLSQSHFEILWRTMIANHGPGDLRNNIGTLSPAPSEIGQSFEACLKFWLAERLSKEHPGTEGHIKFMEAHRNLETLAPKLTLGDVGWIAQRLRDPVSDFKMAAEAVRETSAFARAYDPVAQHRLLYLTEDRQLGLGPMSADVGDEVWLIDGAQVPFILRPLATEEHTYILVGETYVHGFMTGEMLEVQGVGEETGIRIT